MLHACPYPDCRAQPMWGTYLQIYECNHCGTHYCYKCNHDDCPHCGKHDRHKYAMAFNR